MGKNYLVSQKSIENSKQEPNNNRFNVQQVKIKNIEIQKENIPLKKESSQIKPQKKIIKKEPIKKIIKEKKVVKEQTTKLAQKEKEIKKEPEKELKEEQEVNNNLQEKIQLSTSQKENKKVAPSIQSSDHINEILSKIHKIIYQYKSYPNRAKKLKIQGEVLISFTFQKNGNISNIKILRSSGASFLDKHSIDTILDASRDFPKTPQNITVKIPIKYYLI